MDLPGLGLLLVVKETATAIVRLHQVRAGDVLEVLLAGHPTETSAAPHESQSNSLTAIVLYRP